MMITLITFNCFCLLKIVALRELARTTSVLIPVLCLAELAPSVLWRIMLPSVDVPAEPPETHSETAEDSLVMRSVHHVELTQTVRSVRGS